MDREDPQGSWEFYILAETLPAQTQKHKKSTKWKKAVRHPKFYRQESDWQNYPVAKMCYISQKRHDNSEGGTECPERRTMIYSPS